MIEQSAIVVLAKLSVDRLSIAGCHSYVVLGICWFTAALGIVGAHAFIGLFTIAPGQLAAALGIGGLCAFVSGVVAGALIALCYNLTAPRMARATTARPPPASL